MNAAKLREYYQQTQLLLSELQALGADPYGVDRANGKHQQLMRLVLLLRKGTEGLAEKDLRAIWEERSAKLHEDLVALTALRLQRDDQSAEQFWDGCVQLLYAGVAMVLQQESETAALRAELEAHKEEVAKLQEASQGSSQQREAVAKENLELRTKVVVQQQDIQRRDADARTLQQQWQAAVRELDALRLERDKLLQESTKNAQVADRQTTVIAQLMERSETAVKERDDAVATVKQLDEDNHILRVNMNQNGLVIEKLINLNTEVMEAVNSKQQRWEEAEKRIRRLQEGPWEDKTAEYMADEPPASGNVSEEDDVPVSTGPREEELPVSHHGSAANQRSSHHRSGEPPWELLESPGDGGGDGAAVPSGGPAGEAGRRPGGVAEAGREAGGQGAAPQVAESKSNENPAQAAQAEGGGQPEGKRKPTAWTSDMLPVKTKPPPSDGAHENGEAEANGVALPSGSRARSLLRNVGGKAKGFLSYVAGVDKLES